MSRRSAFTLIELLIVVAIIGILAAIAVPNFLNAHVKAKIAAAYAGLHATQAAINMYYLDHGRRFTGIGVIDPMRHRLGEPTPDPDLVAIGRRYVRSSCSQYHGLTTPVSYLFS